MPDEPLFSLDELEDLQDRIDSVKVRDVPYVSLRGLSDLIRQVRGIAEAVENLQRSVILPADHFGAITGNGRESRLVTPPKKGPPEQEATA